MRFLDRHQPLTLVRETRLYCSDGRAMIGLYVMQRSNTQYAISSRLSQLVMTNSIGKHSEILLRISHLIYVAHVVAMCSLAFPFS